MNRIKTRKKSTIIIAWVLAVITFLSVFATGMTAFAAESSYYMLKTRCRSGEQPSAEYGDVNKPVKEKKYKRSGGDYYLYTDITGLSASSNQTSDIISEYKYNQLTAGAKQDFLKDFIQIAYNYEDYYSKNEASNGQVITGETVSDLLEELQQVSGAGSQIMAALMSDTKPDYATANRIYQPFSGLVGTALGLISILIVSLLAVTMALDIAYIVIPSFQLLLDGGDDAGGGQAKGMSRIISQEARSAVKSVSDGGGGGQSGSGNKMAIGQYFKMRWKALIVLGICLLYLVQGQIYSFVAWVIDLVSGFLGF